MVNTKEKKKNSTGKKKRRRQKEEPTGNFRTIKSITKLKKK